MLDSSSGELDGGGGGGADLGGQSKAENNPWEKGEDRLDPAVDWTWH